jgi:hypothetical protein
MKLRALALAFGLALSAVAPAAAQPADGATAGATPDDRATSFRAVSGAEAESVPGGALLVGAYGLVWAFTLLYVLRLAGLSRRTAQDLTRLERTLAEAEARAGAAPSGAAEARAGAAPSGAAEARAGAAGAAGAARDEA